jgi:hypothetical protein
MKQESKAEILEIKKKKEIKSYKRSVNLATKKTKKKELVVNTEPISIPMYYPRPNPSYIAADSTIVFLQTTAMYIE